MKPPLDFQAVVIGSGFGGAVSTCRLSKKWPNQVAVIEQGRRYAMGSFPRSPNEMARNFFFLPEEKTRRPSNIAQEKSLGLFDLRSHEGIDVLLAAGLGGGSLIYANVFLEPPAHVFGGRWPNGLNLDSLSPYYSVAKKVLGARPVPDPQQADSRNIRRTQLFEQFAKAKALKSRPMDLAVFFGNNFDSPAPQGLQETNAYGAVQTSCTYCAECDVGCNTHSKNTLDLNYLFVAEKKYGAKVFTETKCISICPLDRFGVDDPHCSGEYGYALSILPLLGARTKPRRITTQRVVVAAGTLGTNELLLRNRDEFLTLPRLSQCLGSGFSGNGDFLSFVMGHKENTDCTRGPVITQAIDHHLYEDYDPNRAFLLQDAAMPVWVAWFVEGTKPDLLKSSAIGSAAAEIGSRLLHGQSLNRMSEVMCDLFSGDISSRMTVHLCMGIDSSNGRISLGSDGSLDIHWPGDENRKLYDSVEGLVKEFQRIQNADFAISLPTYHWPLRRNVTVHPLGGCSLANDTNRGVVDSSEHAFGQAFGYQGLYVADGSIVPQAVGANPSATIAALAEKISHGLTGNTPDSEL